MADNEKPTDDWPGYEAARQRNNDFHGEYLRSYSERGYEYGILAVKNFMLISGGALIALPALAKLSPDYEEKMAMLAGSCFAFCLLASLACTYIIHLNWTLFYESQELARSRDQHLIIKAYLPSRYDGADESRDFQTEIEKKNRKAWWAWIVPHVLGVISFTVFLLGCWFFYSGFDFSGVKV
ncbi:hypothetical protein [Ruegeria sp. EL01]|jgi:hypothetical protein|uniref:hypothetical protein n=1 Tax=Ruegeria sp. EL01 TaxID=2107578 RepID=UPI000EA820BF|nr:hypothetical protein [Ruegeria sp. EL01]